MIQKDFSNKESSLSFGGLITRVAILAKVPLRDVKPIMKIFGKISVVTVVKSEVLVSKKRTFVDESISSLARKDLLLMSPPHLNQSPQPTHHFHLS